MAGLTTVTSGGISDGTITNVDINASAAIDASKISGLSTDSITEGNTTVEVVDTGSDGHITFDTEGTERMRIDSSGNVGIGTSSPNCELHVGNPSGNPSIEISRGAVGAEHGYRLFGADGEGNVALKFLPVDNGSVGSETMRIDGSGRLLVGTSTSVATGSSTAGLQLHNTTTGNGAFLSIARFNNDTTGGKLAICKSRNTTVAAGTIVQSGDTVGVIEFAADDGTDLSTRAAQIMAQVDGTPGTNDMPGRLIFFTTADGASTPTERMRIANDGRVGINAIPGVYGGEGATLVLNGTGRTQTVFSNINGTSSATQYSFGNGNGVVGTITTSGSATAYNTSSDYRLKENVVPLTGAADRVKALKPSRFNFIAEPDTIVDGFLAHEAQTVVPEAVTGTHDEVDENGDPVMQGIDQSKLVPLLTAALQEAIAKIEILETKVAALEAG